jgi:cytochrome c-type biogenesis protein CcmH
MTATDAAAVAVTDAGRAGSSRSSQPARTRRRLVGWLALVIVLAGALVYGVVDDRGPASPGDRARSLAESVACPQCDGQSVADSDSDAAKGIRTRIDERIAEGASDAQIRDELADAYGERVLLTPGRSGVSSLVWTLPVVAVVVAFAGLAFAFRRWRGDGATRASDADRALVDRARAGVAAAAGGDGAAGDDAAGGTDQDGGP